MDRLLGMMDRVGASDLFVGEGRKPALRINGDIRRVDAPETTAQELEAFLSHAMTDAARVRFADSGDLDLGYSVGQQRFRLNVYRQMGRLGLVARALPTGELTLEQLGLDAGVRRLAEQTRGLVLVTGATGAGKSTTLAAIINHINSTRRAHIVSIEEPIEFVHHDKMSRISQREVGQDTESFHQALRHVVRQSPDVIMLGEMRDAESISVAMAAAMTGHLVLATLHTIDASQTLQRILTYFSEDRRAQLGVDLSLCLKGIVSQRLLPRKDGQGRVIATEILSDSPATVRLLREQRIDDVVELMRQSDNLGRMRTFTHSLIDLYTADVITLDVGKAYATNPEEFEMHARGMNTGTAKPRDWQEISEAVAGYDLKVLLRQTLEQGASDLHLAVGRAPIVRVSGELERMPIPELTAAHMRQLLNSILTRKQRETLEIERELDVGLALDDGQRFRVNVYRQQGQLAAAMRTISSEVPSAESLRLPQQLLSMSDRAHGLLMIVGPTGAGKTTTLACIVDRINQARACRIICIEDPVEYRHVPALATIDQREVHADTTSFAAALKYVLRQDPDVILIGEMRDLETTSAALTAAETGHLVLATLHTNDAGQTVDRIVDLFPPHQQSQARAQLAASLLGVVSQRLLARADGGGRIGAFEVLVATPAVRSLIRDNKMHQIQSTMETAQRDGMVTMDQALRSLVVEGLITKEDALRYARSPTALEEKKPPPAPIMPAPKPGGLFRR